MSENEQNKTDDIFRKKLEEMLFKPPKVNLEELRANVLQTTLQNKVFQNKLLKGSLVIVTLFLGGAIYALLNKTEVPILQNFTEKVVKIYIKDTVYVTKYENKYIKIPVYIYPKENIGKKLYASNQKQINESNEYETAKIIQNNDIEGNLMARNSGNIEKRIPQNANTSNSNADPKHGISEENTIENEPENGKVESYTNEQIKLIFDYLKPKQNESTLAWNLPKVKIKFQNLPAVKPPRDKIPFLDRITVGLNGGFEANKADIRIETIDAIGFNEVELNKTSNWGFRTDFKLSQKLSIISGIEFQKISFELENFQKEQITAIKGDDGNPVFLKQTAFGVAKLPIQYMTAAPSIGSTVSIVAADEHGHYVKAINFPILLKYQFYEKTYSNNSYWKSLKIYGIGGVKYFIPTNQQLKLTVIEPNGHTFNTNIKNFNNVNKYNTLNLGFGAEFNYNKNMNIFFEPYFQTNTESMVKAMPVSTFLQGFGLKLGLNYKFQKK